VETTGGSKMILFKRPQVLVTLNAH